MIRPADLISMDYLETQKALHAAPRGYGGGGHAWADTVRALAAQYDCWSVLDYGCGQGTLAAALRGSLFTVREYDPAIPGKDGMPSFADLVVSSDVLEHIEPEKLDAVLVHIRLLARKVVFLVVNTRIANKVLPDGRNAHLIIEPVEWWEARLQAAGFTRLPDPAVWPEKKNRNGKYCVAVLAP